VRGSHIIRIWNKIFKKENQMNATAQNVSIKKLSEVVNRQENQISILLSRLSELSDQVYVLQNEVKRFKSNVASDVEYLTERVRVNE